jgi:DnaJ-class molecular chaperone
VSKLYSIKFDTGEVLMDTKTCPNCGGDGFEDIEAAFGGILTCPDCSGEGRIKIS